jgi:hypothetical protein
MPAQNVVGMFDGADDEDVPAHAWKRTAEDSPPTAPRKKGVAAMRYARLSSDRSAWLGMARGTTTRDPG